MLQLKDNRYNEVRLIFKEDGHKYTDTLGNSYKSVTTLLGTYHQPFDKNYWLLKKAKELHKSPKEIAAQWDSIRDEACDRGSLTHNGLETGIKEASMFKEAVRYLDVNTGNMLTVADLPNINLHIEELNIKSFIELTNNKYPKIYEVLQFYINLGYKIYAEIGIFLIDFLISGTIDVLLLREDRFVIGDWKTNRGGIKFTSGYYKKDKSQKPAQETNEWIEKKSFLLPPVSNLPDCNGSIYRLQVSLYAFMVELVLGIPCAGLWIFHIDSDFELNEYGRPKRFPDGLYHIKENPQETTTFHRIEYARNEVINILKDRKKEVEADIIRQRTLF